jgi:DNA repair exonuclease SbcCD ATPase subunit
MKSAELEAKYAQFRNGHIRVSTYKDVLSAEAQRLQEELEQARYQTELHQKCLEIFKAWLEESLKKNVDSMAELATLALRQVIPGQELTFEVRQDMKHNRVSIRFVLLENGPYGIVEGDPIHSYGGGAAVVISLVLRLAVMARMHMGNLLMLDESMFALSNVYVPNAISFFRQLSERTGVNILMVTHNPEYAMNAHTAYEGSKNDGQFKLRKLKTDGL